MYRKNVLKSYKLADKQSMQTSFSTEPLGIAELDNLGLQVMYQNFPSLLIAGVLMTQLAPGPATVTINTVDDAPPFTASVDVSGNTINIHLDPDNTLGSTVYAALIASSDAMALITATFVGPDGDFGDISTLLEDANGTFSIEVTNYSKEQPEGINTEPDETVWTTLSFTPSLPAINTSGDNFIVNLNQLPYSRVRFTYTRSAGGGTMDIVATGKAI